MGFAVRVRSAGQKYGPTCHQRDRADVTEFVTLVRLSSLGQHVGVLALAGYKRRKSALTADPFKALTCPGGRGALTPCVSWGWRGLKKKSAPPRIISGTALTQCISNTEMDFFSLRCSPIVPPIIWLKGLERKKHHSFEIIRSFPKPTGSSGPRLRT